MCPVFVSDLHVRTVIPPIHDAFSKYSIFTPHCSSLYSDSWHVYIHTYIRTVHLWIEPHEMFHCLQVLCPRGRLGPKVTSVIQHHCSRVIKDNLTPGSEFWDSTKTLKHLLESNYFVGEENDEVEGGMFRWPGVLKSMLSDGEATHVQNGSIKD